MTKRKISNNIFITATILVALFTLFFGIYEHSREHNFRVDILHSQLQLNNYRYLSSQHDLGIRLTIIDTLGNVLADSEEKDISRMGNHLLRKEIQEALRKGCGYDIKRVSETNGEKHFYSATRFGDSIVRSSVPYSAELTASLQHDYTFFYYTVGILALLVVTLYFRFKFDRSEREKQRIKRQLTENAAHELKTPAATIEGYLETLTTNPDLSTEKQQEFLQRCYHQSRRMSSLLADMSTLTRLDEAHITRPSTLIDVTTVLRQIEEETAQQFHDCGMQLRLNIPSTMPLQGDEAMIDSLFRNIFSNTLAYAANATYFEVQAKYTGKHYLFYFIDNGVGVPPEHLPHIFERFYRVDKSRSRRLGGTGLGLAIAKNIAIQYGGSITAHTTPGGGLTINVALAQTGS